MGPLYCMQQLLCHFEFLVLVLGHPCPLFGPRLYYYQMTEEEWTHAQVMYHGLTSKWLCDLELNPKKTAGLKSRSQVTVHRSGHRSDYRSGHRSHTKTIGHWTGLFLIDILLYQNKTSQRTSIIFFFCSELYQIPHMTHVDHARRTCLTA